MTDCDSARRLLAPYIDGELLAEDRRQVDVHLAECEACLALFVAEGDLATAIRGSLLPLDAPPELREDVLRLMARPHPRRSAPRRAVIAAAALVLAVGGWFGAARGLLSSAEASAFVSLVVDSHLRYADGRLLLEVYSGDPITVADWFKGRVPFNVALPAYPLGPGEHNAYEMSGGRLVSLAGEYVAFVAYRLEDRPISLLVTSSHAARPAPGADVVRSGKLSFNVDSVSGLKVITWTDNGLTYALASDVAVEGARSCIVCHGAPEERSRIEPFGPKT